MKPRSRNLALLAGGLLAAALFGPGCFSMSKNTLQQKLLALEKNAPLLARMQTLEHELELDGARIAAEYRFYRAGASGPERPVVVLVHGTPHSLVTWSEVVFEPGGLAESCDVLALDVVGHGTTRTALEDYTFERCARWVEGFLDALDLRDVTLVGNSYGGEFVWRAALNRPDRVARVVLMSSSGFERRDDEWLPEEIKMREMSLAKIGWMLNSRGRVLGALQPHFQTPVGPERVEEVYLVCSNRDNWHAMIDLARDENGTRSAELAGLRQPALLLWGEQDVAYRPERFGAAFAAAIPDARLELVPGAGHYPQEEQPALVARAIAAFARGE
jgi:pimeloyl-ACP methyl ester carboxylesterase